MSEKHFFVGVDVGTGSVRAALFSDNGRLVSHHTIPLTVHNPRPDYYEQSSSEIWSKVVRCVRQALGDSGVDRDQVRGIGFDATCSLVIVSENGDDISLDDASPGWDVVMWMDHRAKDEAGEINSVDHRVKDFVGGKVSLEMQTPKLKWIKKHRPSLWSRAAHFFDLPDFLTYKSTGCHSRSLCSAVCKWTYEIDPDTSQQKGWNRDFFNKIGLGDLEHDKIGTEFKPPGSFCGKLKSEVAQEMGLSAEVAVGTSIIDAHSGFIGMLACSSIKDFSSSLSDVLGVICGTSSCHMTVGDSPTFVAGVWGPYYSAAVPEMWLLEGGQTAVGSLLDHIVTTHPAYEQANKVAASSDIHLFAYLEDLLSKMASSNNQQVHLLTQHLHVYPDFHGNRSPLADPEMRGGIVGLGLGGKEVEDLALMYLATVQAVAYGTRHIVEQMRSHGKSIRISCFCGGLSRSDMFTSTHADVLSMPVVVPDQTESVLMGAAMLGAVASTGKTLNEVIDEMGVSGRVTKPDPSLKAFHDKKYKVFRAMADDQIKYRKIMGE